MPVVHMFTPHAVPAGEPRKVFPGGLPLIKDGFWQILNLVVRNEPSSFSVSLPEGYQAEKGAYSMKRLTLSLLLTGGLVLLLPLSGGYSRAQTPADITAAPPSPAMSPADAKAAAKAEGERKKEKEKRRSKAIVKNPETPEGRAAEMLVFQENEDCLRKAGISKGDLCSWLGDIGEARVTAIETVLGKSEPYGGKQRTTIAAMIEGTVVVKGKKRKVSRGEIFYLDATRDSSEFADSHGLFRLTFRKDGAGDGG